MENNNFIMACIIMQDIERIARIAEDARKAGMIEASKELNDRVYELYQEFKKKMEGK